MDDAVLSTFEMHPFELNELHLRVNIVGLGFL